MRKVLVNRKGVKMVEKLKGEWNDQVIQLNRWRYDENSCVLSFPHLMFNCNTKLAFIIQGKGASIDLMNMVGIFFLFPSKWGRINTRGSSTLTIIGFNVKGESILLLLFKVSRPHPLTSCLIVGLVLMSGPVTVSHDLCQLVVCSLNLDQCN